MFKRTQIQDGQISRAGSETSRGITRAKTMQPIENFVCFTADAAPTHSRRTTKGRQRMIWQWKPVLRRLETSWLPTLANQPLTNSSSPSRRLLKCFDACSCTMSHICRLKCCWSVWYSQERIHRATARRSGKKTFSFSQKLENFKKLKVIPCHFSDLLIHTSNEQLLLSNKICFLWTVRSGKEWRAFCFLISCCWYCVLSPSCRCLVSRVSSLCFDAVRFVLNNCASNSNSLVGRKLIKKFEQTDELNVWQSCEAEDCQTAHGVFLLWMSICHCFVFDGCYTHELLPFLCPRAGWHAHTPLCCAPDSALKIDVRIRFSRAKKISCMSCGWIIRIDAAACSSAEKRNTVGWIKSRTLFLSGLKRLNNEKGSTHAPFKESGTKKFLASSGNRTRAARVAGEHSTTEPTMLRRTTFRQGVNHIMQEKERVGTKPFNFTCFSNSGSPSPSFPFRPIRIERKISLKDTFFKLWTTKTDFIQSSWTTPTSGWRQAFGGQPTTWILPVGTRLVAFEPCLLTTNLKNF